MVSSLQSIESAMIMMAAGRFPSVVPLMVEAIEKLLKIHFGPDASGMDLPDLIKKFNSEAKIKPDFQKNIFRLRKTRNRYIHYGYSPKDDDEAIELTFTTAMPYIDQIVCSVTKEEVEGLFKSIEKVSSDYLGMTFLDTRRIITRKISRNEKRKPNEKESLKSGLWLLKTVFRVAQDIGYINQWFHPVYDPLGYDWKLKWMECDDGTWWEFLTERRKKNIKELDPDGYFSYRLTKNLCMWCGGDCMIVFISNQVAEPDFQIDRYECADCEHGTTDKDVISIYLKNKLEETDRKKILAGEPPAIDDVWW